MTGHNAAESVVTLLQITHISAATSETQVFLIFFFDIHLTLSLASCGSFDGMSILPNYSTLGTGGWLNLTR